MPELTTIQWTALVGVAGLLLLPRLAVLKSPLASLVGLFRRQAETPDVHAKVDAYGTLAEDLPPELARQVWAAIQSSPTPPATPEVRHDA